MGLDTSHDCWHGSYGSFMNWRASLSYFEMRERGKSDEAAQKIADMGTTREAYTAALDGGFYDDMDTPINVLLGHSDCDGEIAAEDCAPLADALQALADKYMPARALYDSMRPATDRFIAGLRKAAAANEAVVFA
jgi:hypothetical protein